MPPHCLPRLSRRFLPLALLLALSGCMGRWQLDDVTARLRPAAEPQPGNACAADAPPPCGAPLPKADVLAPGAVR